MSALVNQPRRRQLEFPGGPAGYMERGTGSATPLLLIHGFAGDLLSWQFNMMFLARNRRVVAVDLPGHGGSVLDVGAGDILCFTPWLLEVMDRLELPRVHAVGHSMGGRIALALAEAAPHRVECLSLVACAGLWHRFDLDFLYRMVGVTTLDEAMACTARLFGRPSSYSAMMARGLLARMTMPRFRAPLAAIIEGSFADTDIPPFDWSRLAMPVQLIWGGADTIIPLPPDHCLPPGAPLHWLDGVGHMPHLEAASRVNDLLETFAAC